MIKTQSELTKQQARVTKLILSLVLALMILSIAGPNVYGSGSDSWYVGKSATAKSFLKYAITDSELNNGTQFYLVVYFREHVNNESWTGEVLANVNNEIINASGAFDASALNFVLDSGNQTDASTIAKEYSQTIQWLGSSNYAIKPGQSLNAPEWQKVTAIGGSPLSLEKRENITLPSGDFDSVLVTLRGPSLEQRMWINEEVPFPVKAVLVSSERSYDYELVERGTGYPHSIPEFAVIGPAAMLAVLSVTVIALKIIPGARKLNYF